MLMEVKVFTNALCYLEDHKFERAIIVTVSMSTLLKVSKECLYADRIPFITDSRQPCRCHRQRASWQPHRRPHHRQQSDSSHANSHPMCGRSACYKKTAIYIKILFPFWKIKGLGDRAYCNNRGAACRRHNKMLMETMTLPTLRHEPMTRGEQV